MFSNLRFRFPELHDLLVLYIKKHLSYKGFELPCPSRVLTEQETHDIIVEMDLLDLFFSKDPSQKTNLEIYFCEYCYYNCIYSRYIYPHGPDPKNKPNDFIRFFKYIPKIISLIEREQWKIKDNIKVVSEQCIKMVTEFNEQIDSFFGEKIILYSSQHNYISNKIYFPKV